MTDAERRYRIGLPAWAYPGWKGRFFPDNRSTLASYSSVFNTVEGNTTFYATPDSRTVARWCDDVTGRDFRFCFKLPRVVTHERSPDFDALTRFLLAIDPLGDHLGPLFVQLSDKIGPANLDYIEALFAALPSRLKMVLEVRDPRFFESPELLEPILEEYQAGRVVLDSRPIFAGDRSHPELQEALHKKPDLPVLNKTYNGTFFVRLILHPDLTSNAPYIEEWALRTAEALNTGADCYVMIHCPNNVHCPALAETFQNRLLSLVPGLRPLPPWPVPEQQSLL